MPGWARVKCRPADWPTGKLQTKPVDQVRSLLVGWSAGPHYLYKSFFPVADVCITTALDVAHQQSFTCHMESHRLKVVIKSGEIVFLLEDNFRNIEHHLPYGTSKLCNTCNPGTWVECENCSRWHHCRCLGYQCEEFVCQLCWQFFLLTSAVSLA